MYKASDVTKQTEVRKRSSAFILSSLITLREQTASCRVFVWIVVSQKVLAFKKAFRFSHCMALNGLHIYTRCKLTISDKAVIQAHSESVLKEILQFG